MFKVIFAFLSLLTFTAPAFAVGTLIAVGVLELTAGSLLATAVAFAINMVASAVISKAFFSPNQPASGASSPDVGNRQQIPPATDNKLPIVYGTAWVGGTIVDLSISENNQEIYYVIALSEVTGGATPDTITFGDCYWGGKKVVFNVDGYNVDALLDESTGVQDTTVAGKMQFYFYNNGSNNPTNTAQTAITVMNASGLIYTWDATKLMTNTAFAIVHLTYSQTANIRGLEQTRFQITNSRTNTGDVFYDYLTNTVYGGAIPTAQINTTSLDALTTYSNQSFSYTDASGNPATQARFKFNGLIDTNRSIMDNLQDMASCCDCLLKYNEITAQWGVIVQQPTYTVAMDLNDSNMVSAISVNPIDLAGTYNIIECKFPDNSVQDSFNTATFDLAQIDPSLLFANEPVNKMSISLPLVNNDVQAQYIATRLLKSAREDLQLQVNVNFVGIQLEAGDIVTVTNSNYGWVAKPFRINKVIEQFGDDGAVIAKLTLSEFNSAVYDDTDITQFQPAPNTGISDPTFFGTVPAPVVVTQYPNNANPLFLVQVTTSSSGIVQYAEVWYSAYSNPTSDQRIFAGTTEVQSSGNPYDINTVMPLVSLANIPSGNWYIFSRMVNSLASSAFSPASTLLQWRPSTFQYTERYLNVAYGTSLSGAGFSLSPTGKTHYGLQNSSAISGSTNPSDYTWYLADPNFGTNVFLGYTNRTGRKFSFATGFAGYAGGSGSFVLTEAVKFDPSIWSALPDGINYIDLDVRTGQLIETGTTTVGTGEIAVTNNQDGRIVASLAPFLDFGTGVYTKTSSVATLTIDIYGRVVGFEEPDAFYYTEEVFTATAGQTVFNVTRSSGYISGQCLVLENGLLLNTSEYTDTGGSTGTVTFATGRTAGDIITIISVKSVNSSTGVYASFTRNSATLTNASSYTASGFTLNSGYELLFLNGTVVNDQDYDIVGQDITNFPSVASGDLQIIQWTANNLGTPNGTPVNIVTNTVVGQTIYPFSYTASSFNLYENGVLLKQGTDYTTGTGTYTLAVSPDTIQNILVQQTFARTGAV